MKTYQKINARGKMEDYQVTPITRLTPQPEDGEDGDRLIQFFDRNQIRLLWTKTDGKWVAKS